jgi:hypothetical protein
MVDPVEELIIWTAGIFDGEGMAQISVLNKGTTLYTDVMVASDSREITDPIFERWKGTYCNPSMGKYSIEFTPLESLVFLKDIRPHIRYRKERIDIIIAALEAIKPLYDVNNGLSVPKKHVMGITYILIPFYDKLMLLPQPTHGKQPQKRTFTGQLRKIEPKLPLSESLGVKLARLKASIQ